MKFVGALALLLAFVNVFSQSCCCTGAGANYTILPYLNKHVIGLRATHKKYVSITRSINSELNGTTIDQLYTTSEIFGRFNLSNRLQLSAILPYVFIEQREIDKTINTHSPGDISLLLQYQVLNPLRCSGKPAKHQLRLGTGVKLPSGNFKMDNRHLFVTNLQSGTGSVDYLLNVIYTMRIKGYGVNTHATYRINTPNPQQYRFGDRIQLGTSLFYVAQVKDWQIMPNLGFNYEYQFSNRLKKNLLTFTGGQFLSVVAGIDVYYKNFAFSSAFSPTLVNLLNWSGENRSRYGIELGAYYNFSTKPN